MKGYKKVIRSIPILLWIAALPCAAAPREIVIDTIVATVNETPITLSELGKRLIPPRRLTLAEASQSAEAKGALEALITETLIAEEAKKRRISVSDGEVDEYVKEVAERNRLSPEEFEQALKAEGKSLRQYREQIKFEIIKSRLAQGLIGKSAAVTEQEIDEYLKTHYVRSGSGDGAVLQLSQIVVTGADGPEGTEKIKRVQEELAAGRKFSELASRYSDGPTAKEGGSLGEIAEKDLDPNIRSLVGTLKPGGVSKVVRSGDRFMIFRVDKRSGSDTQSTESGEASEEERKQAREILARAKLQDRMATYFTESLYKTNVVDKRL